MNIVLCLDGVIRSETGDFVTDGLILYRSLHTVGRVVLLTSLDRPAADTWLMMHNMSDYDDLIDSSVTLDPAENLRVRQLQVARTRGNIDFYVDADPGMVAEAFRQGITSLLFSMPKYARPEFRPDAPKGVRKWDDIVAERTRQQAMKSADVRLKNDDLIGFE